MLRSNLKKFADKSPEMKLSSSLDCVNEEEEFE